MSCNEWKEVKLDEIIEFNPKESIPKGMLAKKISMDMINPFYKYVNKYEIEEYKGGSKFRNGDTLMARITPCLENGKTIKVTKLGKNEVGFGSTEFIVLRAKEGLTTEDYVYYTAISPNVRDIAIKSMTGTSGRQRAQVNVIENIQIKLPPLNEQKAIAKILSDLDEKIEINNRINKVLEEMAQAIFKRWFVDFEFPNENGEPYKSSGGEMVESELGLIPKGWEVGSLDDICELIRDGTHNPPKRISKGIPLLTGTMFDDGIINYEKATFISTEDYKKIHSKYKPEEGDIVITKIGTLGKVALLRKKDVPIAIHCNSALLRANKSKIDSMFLFYLLKSNYFQEELNKRKGQTVQEFINLTSLGQIKVVVPESRKFEKFKYEVRPFYNLFFKLKDENQTLSQLRDTLLPKLMSGEIRVPLD